MLIPEREQSLGWNWLHMMCDAMGKLTFIFTSADPSLAVERVLLGLLRGPPGGKYRTIFTLLT